MVFKSPGVPVGVKSDRPMFKHQVYLRKSNLSKDLVEYLESFDNINPNVKIILSSFV